MLKGLSVFGATVVVGMAFLGDPHSTGTYLVTIITIRGVSFLLRKITWNLSNDMADILDFTTWCLCAVPIVSIIKNSQVGIQPLINFFGNVDNFFTNAGDKFNQFAQFVDKLTFWN